MTPKQKIIQLCNDPNVNEHELVNAIEKELSKIIPFDHDSDNTLEACGIDNSIELSVMRKESKSKTIEQIENSLNKREIAFVLFQTIESSKDGNIGNGIQKVSAEHPLGKLLSKLEELSSVLDGMSDDELDSKPNTPSTCRETDDSECWKCPSKQNCTKFKGFQQN